MLIDNPFIDNPPIVILKKEKEKVKKDIFGQEKPIFIKSKDVREIRTFIFNLSNTIVFNLENYFSNIHSPYQNPFLYSYFLLVNSKQVATDYFSTDLQKQIIPLLNKAISFEYTKAKKSLGNRLINEENNIWIICLQNIQKLQFNFNERDIEFAMKDLTPKALSFYTEVKKYLMKFQDLEKSKMENLLTPYSPLDREINYIAEIIRKGDLELKPFLKPIANVLLFYKENQVSLQNKNNEINFLQNQKGKGKGLIIRKVKSGGLENYQFYINQLEGINY